jgi:hypothetical protein
MKHPVYNYDGQRWEDNKTLYLSPLHTMTDQEYWADCVQSVKAMIAQA